MTTKGKRTSATFCLAVILFVLSLFARTTECFRLRKTERRDRRREATAGFQPGRILFGNVFEKRSSVDAQARDGAHIAPASAEDDANYQGDSPDLQTQVPTKMKPMDPSVLCGVDEMKFILQGADVHQVTMDPGPAAPPVPLAHIPPGCGYNVQRNPPSLVMMAPYSSCFMIQEGAYYVLPMRWQDTQFSLWCPIHPVSQPTPPPTSSPPHVPQFQPQYFVPPWFLPPGIAPPVQQPQSPPGQQPQSPQVPPGQQPQSPQVPPGQQPQSPQVPHLPQQIMSFPKFPPWNPYPVTTAAPATGPSTTTSPQTTASTTASQQLFQPLFYPMPLSLYPPSLPWGGLQYPPVAEPPVKSKANQQPAHMPGFGYYYPYNFPPVFNPFPQPQPKQPPPKVHPYFPPFGQLPIKVMRYPAA